MGLCYGLRKSFEEFSIRFAYQDAIFGMPLHTDYKLLVRPLETLDDAVGRDRRNKKAATHPIGRLVVP